MESCYLQCEHQISHHLSLPHLEGFALRWPPHGFNLRNHAGNWNWFMHIYASNILKPHERHGQVYAKHFTNKWTPKQSRTESNLGLSVRFISLLSFLFISFFLSVCLALSLSPSLSPATTICLDSLQWWMNRRTNGSVNMRSWLENLQTSVQTKAFLARTVQATSLNLPNL